MEKQLNLADSSLLMTFIRKILVSTEELELDFFLVNGVEFHV